MAIFGLHYIKVSSFFMPMQWTCKNFMNSQNLIQANCKDHVKFHRNLLIKSTSKLSLKNCFFAIFLVRSWFLRSMGAVAQNRLIPQKFHKNRNYRVSKSKIIMGIWFLALKPRKAGNWLRTFYTGLTYKPYYMQYACPFMNHTTFLIYTVVEHYWLLPFDFFSWLLMMMSKCHIYYKKKQLNTFF